MNLEKVKQLEAVLDKYEDRDKNQGWYEYFHEDEEFPHQYVFVSYSKKVQKKVYNDIVKTFGKDNFLYMMTWGEDHEVNINLDDL